MSRKKDLEMKEKEKETDVEEKETDLDDDGSTPMVAYSALVRLFFSSQWNFSNFFLKHHNLLLVRLPMKTGC